MLAGGGPEQERLRSALGDRADASSAGSRARELARAYASADVFLFPSATDTFGQVILEAQASGLPVVAVAEGGPVSLIEDGVSGLLCARRRGRARRGAARARRLAAAARALAAAGLRAVSARTWERALERLGGGYRRALGAPQRRGAAA